MKEVHGLYEDYDVMESICNSLDESRGIQTDILKSMNAQTTMLEKSIVAMKDSSASSEIIQIIDAIHTMNAIMVNLISSLEKDKKNWLAKVKRDDDGYISTIEFKRVE